MVAGALAVLEEDPGRAAHVVARAVTGLPAVMKVYDPDGNYPEGPGYWNYGTTFNVMLISLLETALGTDFGMSQSPGFMKTGEFMLNPMGPSRAAFNFSDCGTGASLFAGRALVFSAQSQPRADVVSMGAVGARSGTRARYQGGRGNGSRVSARPHLGGAGSGGETTRSSDLVLPEVKKPDCDPSHFMDRFERRLSRH